MLENNYDKRSCPNCSSVEFDGTKTIASDDPAEKLGFEVVKDYWRGFRAGNVFFTYCRCSRCGLLYSPTYFSAAQTSDLYSSMEDNTAGESTDVLVKTQSKYAVELDKVVNVSGKWLELGADIGLLTRALLANEKITEVDVIEPNSQVHDDLINTLEGHGKIVDSLTSARPSHYDGVIAVHVLDHISDLSASLVQISHVLKTGGIVCFVTHNEKSFLRKALSKRWPPFCLQHPQLFSPKSISITLENAGFEIIAIRRTTNYFSLRHAASILFSVLRIPQWLSNLFPAIAVPMKLGNIVTYARKVHER